jgi:hypothetical protein
MNVANDGQGISIAFDLSEELRPIYAQFGHALPDKNGPSNIR